MPCRKYFVRKRYYIQHSSDGEFVVLVLVLGTTSFLSRRVVLHLHLTVHAQNAYLLATNNVHLMHCHTYSRNLSSTEPKERLKQRSGVPRQDQKMAMTAPYWQTWGQLDLFTIEDRHQTNVWQNREPIGLVQGREQKCPELGYVSAISITGTPLTFYAITKAVEGPVTQG